MTADLSDTPAVMIARLDSSLARRGQSVVVRRYTGSGDARVPTDVLTRASVRAVGAQRLAGDIDQSYSDVVVSPTGLDALLPLRKGDKIVVQGRELNVEEAKPIVVDDTLVRLNVVAAG